jgi:hypothetical protein
MKVTSIDVGRAALSMAITETRQDEQALRQQLALRGITATAVDFGGEYLSSVKKMIERAVVAAQRQKIVQENHVGEGAIAGATHEALEQITVKATGLNIGGKIGIARCSEHLCVAVYFGIGVLNLDEVVVGLAHRSLPCSNA